ncbi:o-succinylbenzoate synthase [Fictibacillus arsenicus]|uniref:o-succinylbenzoate synthase n=1 Tax=Fictibacillus arsenicus TaxID=255247 RepID=A0A1B1Z953_9BACL|nr:o-succinylbenzoate synthase [Fictibacillus arsenicus]ANX13972.1 o-succinylbenzoate synthase [Fictibacillus arsenicus]
MEIENIDLHRLKMPLKTPFETSFGRLTYKDFLVVCVNGEGQTGYGESVSLPFPIYNEETTDTVKYMLKEFFIPKLLKLDGIDHPEQLQSIFKPIRRNQMAKAAIEGAVWDLYCKKKGISLSEALGGTKKEIDVGVSIGIEPGIPEVLEKVETFINQGYKKIKLKIKPGFDLEPIAAIRDRFGSDIPLMADANSAYTLEDIHLLRQLDPFHLMMIEQPLAHDDIIDHVKLQSELSTPICLDESIHSYEDARKAIEIGACKIINIKIGRVGGLAEAVKIHDLCKSNGIPVWCGGMLEAGIGRAHNIALSSLDNFLIPGDTSASNRYWETDIVTPEVDFLRPGTLAVPDGYGIGYEINEKVMEKYRLETESFSKEKSIY